MATLRVAGSFFMFIPFSFLSGVLFFPAQLLPAYS
jgi:hypothetical protein